MSFVSIRHLFRPQRACLIAVGALVWAGAIPESSLQAADPPHTQKKASALIQKQKPAKVNPRLLKNATPENVSLELSLSKQRAYLLVGEEIAVDSPISSGKRAGMTPKGTFTIVEKDPNHRSSLYGNFVNARNGKIVRRGVSTRIDSAPSGTVYRGAPMNWFMRFGDKSGFRAEGMHTGILPGYPASHGCVRFPDDIAKLIYGNVVIGTKVTVDD